TMRRLLIGLATLSLTHVGAELAFAQAGSGSPAAPASAGSSASAQAGAPPANSAGRLLYNGQNGGAFCSLCHGPNAEGGFGPDLAGRRGLSTEQFTRGTKQPWGLMPTFPYLTDDKTAQIWTFVKNQPSVAQPGKWRIPMPPPGGPDIQRQFISIGCGQCH